MQSGQPLVPRIPLATIKARGVIIQGNKIFLGKLAKYNFACLPGGTLEPRETLRECLARELMEELGVIAKIGSLVYTQEIIRESSTMFDFWYWIENPDDFINIDLSTVSHGFEHDEVGFYNPRTLDLPLRPERYLGREGGGVCAGIKYTKSSSINH
jgi:8-oxo-dGTP pyrophosphatase MutT (NUDIX family)